MNGSHYETSNTQSQQFVWVSSEVTVDITALPSQAQPKPSIRFAPLQPLRQWLDQLEIRHRAVAHAICRVIPARCPFERTISFGGKVRFKIPPLCKLNPFYEQFVGLRFRALCYLADECHEDISCYY